MTRVQVLRFGMLTALMASGYGVMFTVLDDFRDEYGIAAQWLGLLVGIGFLAGFLAQIFLAPLADRGRARLLVLGGMAANVVGLTAMALGETLPILLAGRLVAGLGVGMAYPAIRRIVINGDPDNMGSNLGLLLAADVAGFATGPAVAAVLVPSLGIPAPFFLIAALTLLSVPIVLGVEIAEAADDVVPSAKPALDLLRSRPIVSGLMMGAAVFLMIGTFDALWAIVLDDLEASEFVANLGITIFALPLIVLGSVGGRLAQRVGPYRLGTLGLIVGAVFMMSYGLLPTGLSMLAVGSLHAISDGLTVSSSGVAIGLAAPAERQASAQGLLGAAQTLSGGVTAVMAGFLYSIGGRTLAYAVCAALMVVLALGSFWLAGPAYRARRPRSRDVASPDPASAVTGHA